MPSKSIFAYALEEELQTEKLARQELEAGSQNGSEVLFDELQQQKDVEANAEATKSEANAPDGGDSADDLSAVGGDAPGDDAEVEPSDEEALAREEFRNVTFSLESTKDDSQMWSYKGMPSGGTPESAARSQFAQTAAVLGTLGINLTAKLVGNLFKGVVYVFEHIGRLMFVGGKLLAKYMERRKGSFQSLKENLQSLTKTLDMLVEKGVSEDLTDKTIVNETTINALKIHDSVDVTANIGVLSEFVKVIITDLGDRITNDIAATKHIAFAGTRGTGALPKNIMNVSMVSQQFVPGAIDGYDTKGEFTESYVYNHTLPSNVVLMAELPANGLTDLNEITKAYNDSSMILGFDQATFKEVKSVPILNVEQLRVFINELDKLCDLCIAHQAMYEKIQRVKSDLVSSFKGYFFELANKTQKVSLQTSFVEQVYLKAMFVDKVYLSAAMDIHDYTAKTINSGISFVKDNLEKLA